MLYAQPCQDGQTPHMFQRIGSARLQRFKFSAVEELYTGNEVSYRITGPKTLPPRCRLSKDPASEPRMGRKKSRARMLQ